MTLYKYSSFPFNLAPFIKPLYRLIPETRDTVFQHQYPKLLKQAVTRLHSNSKCSSNNSHRSRSNRLHTVSEVRSKNMSRGNQQLFAQVCHLLWTHRQQSQHAFHHLCRMDVDTLLVDANDVCEERQSLDLCRNEIHEHFLVERWVCPVTHSSSHHYILQSGFRCNLIACIEHTNPSANFDFWLILWRSC